MAEFAENSTTNKSNTTEEEFHKIDQSEDEVYKINQSEDEIFTSSSDQEELIKTEDLSFASDRIRDLLDAVFSLESEKQEQKERYDTIINKFKTETRQLQEEHQLLKKKYENLEQNYKQAMTSCGSGDGGQKTSAAAKDLDDSLIKAKTLLFEKTKINKQQEQQIAVLKGQVESIKEVLSVTKEMLNLKGTEIEHLQGKLETSETRIKVERDKSNLLEKKLTISKKVYDNLKDEYENQNRLFKQMKQTYDQKVQVLLDTINKLRKM